jgi:hypothetical protein
VQPNAPPSGEGQPDVPCDDSEPPASRAGLDAASLARNWIATLAILAVPAAISILTNQAPRITAYFLLAHDLPVLALQSVALALACLPAVRLSVRGAAWIEALAARRGGLICAGLALACAVLAFAGWTLIYQRYPLSIDEMWADFDTRIFAHGHLVAPIAPAWRPFAAAMQPQWRMQIAGDVAWASTYLPVNAAFRALATLAGSPALAGAAWAALSVAATWGLARRYWHGRPDAALVATLLLATSTQMLVAAMSPYAMSAHLALNLAWLWLFQRKGAASQTAAMAVAFLATGLHQLIFFPLFAAPFVLQLWMQRRWRLAAAHTAAYAAIILFWACYWRLTLGWLHLAAAPGADLDATSLIDRALAVLHTTLAPVGPLVMADNLLRFIAWQNPLAIVLALAALLSSPSGGSVWTRQRPDEGGLHPRPTLWPLAAGIALTLLAMLPLAPFQGFGWGFRYLHGLLGSVSLLAAAAWVRWVRPGEASAARGWAMLGAATAFSVLVAAPIQLAQAHALIAPFAKAQAAIQGAKVRGVPADVVVVDETGIWYGQDLVRNDPFLEQGPRVMSLQALAEPQLRTLCGEARVALFDRTDAREFGVLTFDTPTPPDSQTLRLRAVLAQPVCAGGVAAG